MASEELPNEKPPMIKLESKDKVLFEVELDVGRMFLPVKDMLETFESYVTDPEPIPLSSIPSTHLKVAIHWCEYQLKKKTKGWEMDLLSLKDDGIFLYALMASASFLGLDKLVEELSGVMAAMIRNEGKMLTSEEIRKKFKVRGFPSEEAEKKVVSENDWINPPEVPENPRTSVNQAKNLVIRSRKRPSDHQQ